MAATGGLMAGAIGGALGYAVIAFPLAYVATKDIWPVRGGMARAWREFGWTFAACLVVQPEMFGLREVFGEVTFFVQLAAGFLAGALSLRRRSLREGCAALMTD